MSADDLATIPSLTDEQRAVLREDLGVTTCRALVMAERAGVVDAMRRHGIKPLPSRAKVAEWQDEARAQLAAAPSPTGAASAMPDWERAASFAVVFDRRQGEAGPERRLAVEQTELEGPAPEHEWPSWDCSELCAWMGKQLEAAPARTAPAKARRGRGRPARAAMPLVQIDGVWLVDPDDERAVAVESDQAREALPYTSATSLAVAATAPSADQVLSVVVMLCPPGVEPRELSAPAEIVGSGRVEFALSPVPEGRQEGMTVYAWVPLGGAAFDAFALPPLDRLPD